MYRYYVTKRAPVSVWMLDDTPVFQEISGVSAQGVMTSGHPNPTKSVPLVAGAEYSSVFKSGVVGRFDCNVFKQGLETRQFVLEAWVLPIPKTTSNQQKILSHDNVMDGLTINGKVVRFGTTYTNFGDAYCDYDLGEYKLAHVVGIHNKDQNQLWVNGELVASVNLTDDQKGDTYNIVNNNYLYSGTTTGDSELAVNGIAFYSSLSGDDIRRNYEAGIGVIGQDRVYPQFGGTPFDLAAANGAVFIEEVWADKADFERGMKSDVEYAPDQIEPHYTNDLSIAGTWTTSIALDSQADTSIYGVMVAWSGFNVTVEVSLDGVTWTPAVSGDLVSIIPNGYNPTGKDLQIRAKFASGLALGQAWLESLTVVGFRNNTIENLSARPLTVGYPAVVRGDFEPNLYRDDNGIHLHGATLTIGPDASTVPDIARVLELWVKPVSGAVTINVAGTKYRNGVADTSLPVGEWSLVHIVASADITSSVTVSGNAIIGQAALYPDALTAADIDFIWKSYTGRTAFRVTETTTTSVTESATPAFVYAHDWAIDSAG